MRILIAGEFISSARAAHQEERYSEISPKATEAISSFYGLGNFAFDLSSQKEETFWNRGFLVEFSFGESIGFKIYPYRQYAETPSVELLPEDAYRKELIQLNAIIGNKKALMIRNHIECQSHRDKLIYAIKQK